MEYGNFSVDNQRAHIAQRIATCEEMHYSSSVSIELMERLGVDPDDKTYLRDRQVLAETERLHVELHALLAEME